MKRARELRVGTCRSRWSADRPGLDVALSAMSGHMIRTLTFRGTGHSPLWVYTLYAMHSRTHKENIGS
jgi:hypothetical protein